MSLLKAFALANISLMSVTLDASHSPMGPCGPVEQSLLEDSFRNALTALLSSALDCGENNGVLVLVLVHSGCDIDADEPLNMEGLLAFERSQADPHCFWLNIFAFTNMKVIRVTLDTSHLEMSELKKSL
jgi:hypothetical protein